MKRLLLLCLLGTLTATYANQGNWITPGQKPTLVTIKTNLGPIVIQLDKEAAPISSQNFIRYVEEGFYDGTVFHRVIPEFMVQAGGYNQALELKDTHPSIPNESGNGLSNQRGTVAMARTPDPHSGTAQFFINVNNNTSLDPGKGKWGYAVFGRVIDGMDVVDKIVMQPTHAAGPFRKDVPKETIIIEQAYVAKQRGGPAKSQ